VRLLRGKGSALSRSVGCGQRWPTLSATIWPSVPPDSCKLPCLGFATARKAAKEEGGVATSNKEGKEAVPSLEGMTVVQLKEECKRRRLKVSGNKGELLARLQGEPSQRPTLAQQQQKSPSMAQKKVGPTIRVILAEKKCMCWLACSEPLS